jgi:hypothetical protein
MGRRRPPRRRLPCAFKTTDRRWTGKEGTQSSQDPWGKEAWLAAPPAAAAEQGIGKDRPVLTCTFPRLFFPPACYPPLPPSGTRSPWRQLPRRTAAVRKHRNPNLSLSSCLQRDSLLPASGDMATASPPCLVASMCLSRTLWTTTKSRGLMRHDFSLLRIAFTVSR